MKFGDWADALAMQNAKCRMQDVADTSTHLARSQF
jgi:hypothetical protein